jgi:hypothetical protein
MQPAGKKLIDRLPQDQRDAMIAVGREALGRLTYTYQHLFDTHIDLFELVADRGATAAMIGKMLCEAGIAREDGSALPPGTVSSAMSRAKERRAAQQLKDPRPAPAQPGTDMQVAAVGDEAMHARANRDTTTSAILAGMAPTAPAPSRPPAELSHIRPSPKPSGQLPTATSRAAALLEQLRSEHERDHDD